MKMKHEPLLNSTLGVSERIYRQLLLAYPAEFRVDFGESMLQLFRDELTDAERRRGYSGVLRLWPRMLTDLIANALRARRWQMFHAATCPALTTVWAGAEVDAEGAPTQDERYLSYVDWDTGDLALRDLASGESRHLTHSGPFDESPEFAGASTISPEGTQLAYSWSTAVGYELRLVNMDGSMPRVVYCDERVPYIEPQAWSPDGQWILALARTRNETWRIMLVSVQGKVRVLRELDRRRPQRTSFRPDGRYIAYDLPASTHTAVHDIFVLAVDGGGEYTIVHQPADDRLLSWTPDGKHILFASDRRGTMDAWLIDVCDGIAAAPARLVCANIGADITPMGFTANGNYYYGASDYRSVLFLVTLDGTESIRQIATDIAFGAVPDWSPDGTQIAYVSHRGPNPWDPDSSVVVILCAETGERRELPLKLRRPGDRFFVRWSPDGRSLLAMGSDHSYRLGSYRIDAETGEVSVVAQTNRGDEKGPPAWNVWSADGTKIFHRDEDPDAQGWSIAVRDIQSGKEIQLYRSASMVGELEPSPDGKWLAFVEGAQIPAAGPRSEWTAVKVMPVAGGDATQLLRMTTPESIVGLGWMRDSDALVFGKLHGSERGESFDLWRIPIEGGQPERLGSTVDGLRLDGLCVNPDGRRVAFAAGPAGGARVQVRKLENLLRTSQ